ncbi:MAG: hypothetical protein WCO30_00165 [bacterium]
MESNRKIDWRKYAFALVITGLIFGTAIFLGNYFNNKRISQVSNIESNISLDIMASETQFALLSELTCENMSSSTALSQELNNLDERLAYIQNSLGTNNEEFIRLKKQYSVLEIKDYLLLKKLDNKCKTKPISILYFYTNECFDCTREGYVLTQLRQNQPNVRIYSFDLSMNMPVINTFAKINKIDINKMPAVIIQGKLINGFNSLEDLEKLLPPVASTTNKTK